jgi:hypothetical protein
MAQNTGRKTYRTAAGKHLDMEAMLLHNEEAIAVGNNPVNARGDEIGPGGEVIRTNSELVQEYYSNNPNAVQKSQPIGSITEDLIPDDLKNPATVTPAMSVEEQPAPEVSSTPKQTPAPPAISADPTVVADEATQSALEKKIKKAAAKAKNKAQEEKAEAEAKLPKAVTGALDNLDLG